MTNSLVDWFNTLPTAVLLLSALFGVGWLVLRAYGSGSTNRTHRSARS